MGRERDDHADAPGAAVGNGDAAADLATAIAKVANPLLLHLPLDGMTQLPTFAFPMSPAEVPRGAVYEFAVNHAVDVDDPGALFRTEFSDVNHD
jgi:hypothetical protein